MSSDNQAIVSKFFGSNEKFKNSDDGEDEDEETEGEKTEDETTEKSPEEKKEAENAEAEELSHLKFLFSFLEDKSVNLTSAGYFAKIVNNLLNKKPTEVTFFHKIIFIIFSFYHIFMRKIKIIYIAWLSIFTQNQLLSFLLSF